MRILIDLQGAQNTSRFRGIGRYSTAFAKAIARNAGGHEIFLLLNGLFPKSVADIKESFSGLIPEHHILVFSAPAPVAELHLENSWRVRAAELLRESVIIEFAPDILLVSSLFEGICDNTVTSIKYLDSPVLVAVMLYDLIPYLDPENHIGHARSKAWYYRKIESFKRADLMLAISGYSGREAIDTLQIAPRHVVNIMSAADDFFTSNRISADERIDVLCRYGITRKFLMHTGVFDERKNFEGLIKAFGSLPETLRKDYQLVLASKINETGRNKLEKCRAEASLGKNDLILTGYVPDEDLRVLYSSCHLFVFPSLYEGFGLPPLEAMRCGAAVIGSAASSIPEVIGRDDALFDPKSTASMASLIQRALTDHDYWNSLKEHAKVQSGRFSWDMSAQKALEAFEGLQSSNKSSVNQVSEQSRYDKLVSRISQMSAEVPISEVDMVAVAKSIYENEKAVRNIRYTLSR